MKMLYGLTVQASHPIVADTANSRLLGFDQADISMGSSARWVTGQHRPTDKGDNRRGSAALDGLCWPSNAAANGTMFVVADSGDNRVLHWDAPP
jgi:hypothetical protein